MSIKNLMEDIVKTAVEQIMNKDNDLAKNNANIDDIAAYVLNRVPPKYVTSERGVLHGKLHTKLATQQKTDVFLLIYEAIEVIKTRRASETEPLKESWDYSSKRFPHIIGQVLEETTFSIVPDIEIILYSGKNKAEMMDSDWKNPYITNKSTMGYYHFWPAYDKKMGKGDMHKFTLEFRHNLMEHKSFEIDLDLSTPTGIGMSYVIPITLMQPNKGVDLKDICGIDCEAQ